MEMRYALYLADPVFYDDPNRARNANPDFELAGQPVPAGWQRSAFDHWLVYSHLLLGQVYEATGLTDLAQREFVDARDLSARR